MSCSVGYSTPMFSVADIERSVRFYEILGFHQVDSDGHKPLGWVRIHCKGAALMFMRAEKPVDAAAQGVVLYMYSPELRTLREHLLSRGVDVPEIEHPEHMPGGELRFTDPDGYSLAVGHWGVCEQEEWELRIGEKAQLVAALR